MHESEQPEPPISFDDLLHDSDRQCVKYTYREEDISIKWVDLTASLAFAAERKNTALACMMTFLGYIPEEPFYMPHLSYIQILLENMQSGIITKDAFYDQILEHMKNIRNDHMKKDGWVNRFYPGYHDRRAYKEFLPQFKQPARQRLSELLGFEPALKYSWQAEMHLRTFFERDYYEPNLPFGQQDFRAATIVTYRKVYFHFGESVADQSKVFAAEFDTFGMDDYLKSIQAVQRN